MNAELHERFEDFVFARRELDRLVVDLTDERFNQRPEEGSWSIAECVDHLLVTGAKLIPRMETAIVKARERGWLADGPFRYGALGNWFVRASGAASLPPRSRYKAPRLYMPVRRPGRKISQAVEDFARLQEEYLAIVRAAEGLDLARIKIASPVTRLVRLSLGQWLASMGGHQRRHLWQASRVRERVLGD